MPGSETTAFLEISEFSARYARLERCDGRSTIVRLDEIALNEVAGKGDGSTAARTIGTEALAGCLVRARDTYFHLASAAETRAHVTSAAIRRHLEAQPHAPKSAWQLALAAAGEAHLGMSGKAGRWLAAMAPDEALSTAQRWLGAICGGKATACATLTQLIAARRLLKTSGRIGEVLLLELGRTTSTAFVVSAAGIEVARRLACGLQQVYEAISRATNAPDRHEAARRFFDPEGGCAGHEGDVAVLLARSMREELDSLRAGRGRETAGILLSGLPGEQAWLGQYLAEALDLPWWNPSLSPLLERAGLLLDPALGSLPGAEWLAMLGMMDLHLNDAASAVPIWSEGERRRAETRAAGSEGRGRESGARGEESQRRRQESEPRRRETEGRGQESGERDPETGFRGVDGPGRIGRPLGDDEAPAVVERGPEVPSEEAHRPTAEPGKPTNTPGRKWQWVAMAGSIVIAGALAMIYLQEVEEQKARALADLRAAEQRAEADRDALLRAEQRAAEEAEARRKAEEEAAARIAEAQASRERAEKEAVEREQAAQRLLAMRGVIRVATEPAGAIVTVGNYAPATAPALIPDLRLGAYPVALNLPGYEEVVTEVEIVDEEVVDLGVIRLQRSEGTVAIDSIPQGVPFEVRAREGATSMDADAIASGVTPADLSGLPPGAYVVVFRREGWPDQEEPFQVEHRTRSQVSHRFLGAALRVASTPVGATVVIDGVTRGVTPVVLPDVAPGEKVIEVVLDGYEPERVQREAAPERLVDLNLSLRPMERIYAPNELDVPPKPVHLVLPKLERNRQYKGRRVIISFQINTHGHPEHPVVLESPTEEIARRCLEALANWEFSPAMAGGRAVRTSVSLPFLVP